MKSDTIFINISREPLIDESALIDALLKNGIAGAGAWRCSARKPLGPHRGALLLSLCVMLVVSHPAGQITTRDRFDCLVANGDETAHGAVSQNPGLWGHSHPGPAKPVPMPPPLGWGFLSQSKECVILMATEAARSAST